MIQYLIASFFILLILLYIVTRFADYNYIMTHLSDYLYDIIERQVMKEFKKQKKAIYTKRGNITANFNKTVQNRISDVSIRFYSKDFFYYYKQHRPVLKRNIPRLLNNFLANNNNRELLSNNFNNMTPEQFFELRKKQTGDMVGVYILYNKNKKMYYVGQATRLFFRVNQHFTGHGNGDVYADWKRGKDKFIIKLIPLVNSGYYDLDKLEKDMITQYDAYNNGYNKTIGNGDF